MVYVEVQWNAVRLAKEQDFSKEDELADFMKEEILASIEMFIGFPFGDSTKYIHKYFSY